MSFTNIRWRRLIFPLRSSAHGHKTRQTIQCISRGSGVWFSGHRGATKRDDDPSRVLPNGLWFLQTITVKCEPKKPIEPILHLPGAAFTREHGFEVEADQDSHLIGGIVGGGIAQIACLFVIYICRKQLWCQFIFIYFWVDYKWKLKRYRIRNSRWLQIQKQKRSYRREVRKVGDNWEIC